MYRIKGDVSFNLNKAINRLFAYCKGGNFYFINVHCSAISSAYEGKSGSIYKLVKN